MAVTPLIVALAGLFGAAIGSFITLVTWRMPLGEKIGMTRSRCTSCEATLRLPDLIPIFSWLASRGKCRYCKTPVSVRYPLTEFACAIGTMGVVVQYGLTLEALAITGLWWCIVAIFVTDLEEQIILDEVQIAVGLFGILHGIVTDTPAMDMISSAVVGVAIGLALKYGYLYFRNKDGLGLGDVKFLAVAGIWLADGANFVPFLFYSGILGVLSGGIWHLLGRGERFPFGPALAIALFFCVVAPDVANQFWGLYGLLR